MAVAQRSELYSDLRDFPFYHLPLSIHLMTCVVYHCEIFQPNSEVLEISIRHKYDIYKSTDNFTVYHKGTVCARIKLYNKLQIRTKSQSTNRR